MINQILSDILMNVYTYCFVSILLAVLASSLLAIIKAKGLRFLYDILIQSIKHSNYIRQTVFLFFIFLILNRTVLGRNVWVNPWSNVIGNWGIFSDDGSLNIDFIENIALFVPIGYMYNWMRAGTGFFGIKETLCKETETKEQVKILDDIKNLGKIVFGALIFSLSIECAQLLLKIGVFQLSDIFCNALGGFLGGTLSLLMKKICH